MSGLSTTSSVVMPKDWEDVLQPGTEGDPSALMNMVVERGLLAKAARRM